jgi:hypothetical protein
MSGTEYPLPCGVQNLENKGLLLRLCARSLGLQELHAKSREHGSYGWPSSRFGTAGNWTTRRRRHTILSPHWGFTVPVCQPTACAAGAAFLRRFAAGGGSQIGVWRNPAAAEAGGSSRACGMDESMPSHGSIDALRRSELSSQIVKKSVLSER